jgi:2-aminophenol/2-amino-5-chlorophenol 1,6-dioxygenase subunit alpha
MGYVPLAESGLTVTLVSAFLVPGSPLPFLRPQVPHWARLVAAMAEAGTRLRASKPDVVLIYSTQWIAVLDQLWQMRPRVSGVHVDENWHDLGDLPFDFAIDVALTQTCLAATPSIGIRSRPVDYDAFPVDSGAIATAALLGLTPDLPVVLTSNNVYHDPAKTAALAALAVAEADKLGRRVAVLGVGGLSGSLIRDEIDFADDHIASESDDQWNHKLLDTLASGDRAALDALLPDYAKAARADMGMKHLSWVLGACGDHYAGAETLAYAPTYGSGSAVVQFKLKA